MPTNEEGCEVLAQWYKDSAVLTNKIKDAVLVVTKAIGLKMDIKWGNIPDIFVSDLVTGIAAVSNKIAGDIAGDISKMASSFLENVFNLILKVLLASPKAVFSLVAIPHEMAKDAARKERRFISNAQENLVRIRSIISKWTNGYSGSDYYDQIARAQPYIEKAINAAKQMIDDLETTDFKDGFPPNGVFNKTLYQRLQLNLQSAIDITIPHSTLENTFEINKKIDDIQARIYNEKAREINADISVRRKNISKQYAEDMAAIGVGRDETPGLTQATKQETVKIRYREQITALSTLKAERLALADAEAKTEAIRNWKEWLGGDTFIAPFEEFKQDVRYIGNELYEFLENVKDAYTKNVECQLYCNNIWNIRAIIRTLISQILDYLSGSGNLASKTARSALQAAYPLMQVTDDNFNKVIEQRLRGNMNSTEMTSTLAIGNAALLSADALLDSTITDSLIKLINADDNLIAEDAEFNEFLTRLSEIRDWDGQIGVWSVDMQSSATSPYIQLVADATTMLASLPILSMTRDDQKKQQAAALVRNTSSVFKKIRTHNSEVMDALDYYTPYMNEDASALMRILDSAGMLKSFAMGMSLVSLATDVVSDFGSMLFNSDAVNYENCRRDYREKFEDPDIAQYAAMTRQNFPSKEFYPRVQENAEANEIKIAKVKTFMRSANFLDRPEEDLRGIPPPT